MIFATDQTMPMHRLAPEVEARGFESLWVTEKTHVPASRRTAWPGGELPEWYLRTGDPFIALAGAAATTTTLRVGTGVALVGLRDPVITAKTIATLDWQSAGRLELGVGYGWNEEEMATHGVALADGPARLAESLALMRALWGNDIGEFAGEHVAVEPSWSWPNRPSRVGHLSTSERRPATQWLPTSRHGATDGYPSKGTAPSSRRFPGFDTLSKRPVGTLARRR